MKNTTRKAPDDITCVNDIFQRAKGGVVEIAYKLGVHTRTIEGWPKRGINDKYWESLYELYDVLPIQCFMINAKIRRYRANVI